MLVREILSSINGPHPHTHTHVNALTFKNIVWDHKVQNVFFNYYINEEGLFCGEKGLYNLHFSLEVPQNQLKHPLKSLASLYFFKQPIKLNYLAKKKIFSHGAFQVQFQCDFQGHFQCDFQYHFQHPKNCTYFCHFFHHESQKTKYSY